MRQTPHRTRHHARLSLPFNRALKPSKINPVRQRGCCRLRCLHDAARTGLRIRHSTIAYEF